MDEMRSEPLVVEKFLNAPIDRVWNAITDENQIKEWFFEIKDFRLETGFEFQFVGGKGNVRYLILCKVVEVVKGRKFSYSWRYEGFRGDSKVTFELFPESEGTRLKLTHAGLESFPMSKPDFLNGYFQPEWEDYINAGLQELLNQNNH